MSHTLRLTLTGLFLATLSLAITPAQASAEPNPAPATTSPVNLDYGAEVSRLISQPDEIVATLHNGMVVITKRLPSPVVSVRGYVKTGGIYEGRWLGGGLSHLLEHLVAGGSNDRRTEAENRNLLQEIGNDSNASTGPNLTQYYVNTTSDNLDKAVDLVTGYVLGAKITEAEFQRERQVVQRELEMDEGNPSYVFALLAERNRYRVSPAGVPIIGYQAVIQGLTREDVYAYYKQAYQPNNMVFVVTGNLEPQRMLQAVQKYVRTAPPGRVFSHDIADEPAVIAPRSRVATFPKLGQAKLQLAFPSIKLDHPDQYPLDLLAAILGHGESSVLVEEICDKRNLASTITAYDDTPDYAQGTFAILLEVDPSRVPEVTAAIFEQIDKIKKEGISEERLQHAKTQTKTARAFRLQTSEEVGDSLATDFISTGDPHFSDRYVTQIEKVTVEQVRDMANKYLDPSRLMTTALVPADSATAQGLPAAVDLLRAAVPTTQKTPTEATPTVTRAQLGDGTILLLKRVATAPIVEIRLYALGGVTAEDAKTNGLGNLAMLTVPRGTQSRSAQQIAQFFDSIGGDLSTAGGNNSWNWSATCLKEDLQKTLEVFADAVKNPTFPDPEVQMTKSRLLAAIEAQDADWFGQSMRFFRKTYFGPGNSPYQFMPIGTKQTVSTFTPEQVRQWYADKILQSRRVLAIYGDIDIEQARSLAAAQFASQRKVAQQAPSPQNPPLAQTDRPDPAPSPDKPAPDRPQPKAPNATIAVRQVAVNPSPNPQAGVIVGFDSRSVVGSPSLYPLTVADTMASGYRYPTGYLFEVLRGQGLVYNVQAVIFPGRTEQYPGAFIVYAGCEPEKVNQVVEAILQNIARLQAGSPVLALDWFNRSKELIVTADALDNETAAAQATTAALDELLGLGYDYHTRFADHIKQVQIEQVTSTSRRLLGQCTVTISTNAPQLVEVKEGERRYNDFPPVELTPRGVQHDLGETGK